MVAWGNKLFNLFQVLTPKALHWKDINDFQDVKSLREWEGRKFKNPS